MSVWFEIALRRAWFLWLSALALVASAGRASASDMPHVPTAFYYGANVPRELSQHFDRLVIDVDNIDKLPAAGRAKLFAYVSIGEIGRGRPWRSSVPSQLVVVRNSEWGSEIVDTANPVWRDFVLRRIVEPIYQRGLRGLFLDNLDSYQRLVSAPRDRLRHEVAIASLIDAIRQVHPDVQVLVNRGFEVIPHLSIPPDGLIVESLYRTADPSGRVFKPVPDGETAELIRAIDAVRSRTPLPVTSIEYVPMSDAELRRATALRVLKAGFDPYVTVPSLDRIGLGRVEIVPRRVLLMHRSAPGMESLSPPPDAALAAPILEWLGYAVDYADVRYDPPAGFLPDRYAGIVVVAPNSWDSSWFGRWIVAQMDAGLRVAFVSGFGFTPDGALLRRMGLEVATTSARTPIKIAAGSSMVPFEAPARPNAHDLPPYRSSDPDTSSQLRLVDADGSTWDAIVTGRWGGVAFGPYVVEPDLDEGRRWIVDPFQFFTKSLALQSIPAPDVTTESGRRLLTVHIDGDGFVSHAERPGAPFAARVILDEFLVKYSIPHTVSVIEGELSSSGLYPSESDRAEALAREIFRLPHVEAASHTFSHPFTWSEAEAGRRVAPLPMLAIPNYVFDSDREIGGSIAYINHRLLPEGKTVRVLFWSGDCSPSAHMLDLVERQGVENVNGGGSTRTADHPSLTLLSPLGIPKGSNYQVFAPVQNENVYTNDWHGPYYGFEHAIETFELNDSPRRLGPISIYYHFFSGIKVASVAALRKVYEWALSQETTKIYIRDYAAKVRGFQSATLARRIDDGAWEIGAAGDVRTFRLPGSSWPDIGRSVGVAGVRVLPQGRYVHCSRDVDPLLVLAQSPPSTPFLVEANGRVVSWLPSRNRIRLRLTSYEPLRFLVGSAQSCVLETRQGQFRGTTEGSGVRFALAERDTGEATLDCR